MHLFFNKSNTDYLIDYPENYFVDQLNNNEFRSFQLKFMLDFLKMKPNNQNIKNTQADKLDLNQFYIKYKKMLHGLYPVSIMKKHPIFSSLVSIVDLQIQIEELQKENIELKKQLVNLKK
ncbi:MAG: hypothetical protein OXF77_01995 [Thaumarchaeota archaeon]|nr:hypothetical protein [Nitrososphaerota archaeon]